jgi:hypothetical protein
MVFFLQLWALLETVLKSFLTIWQLFYFEKQTSPMHPSSLANSATAQNCVAECCYLLVFVRRHRHCRFCWRLFAYGYTNIDPHFLWKQTGPLASSGLRQEA